MFVNQFLKVRITLCEREATYPSKFTFHGAFLNFCLSHVSRTDIQVKKNPKKHALGNTFVFVHYCGQTTKTRNVHLHFIFVIRMENTLQVI